MSLPLLPTLEEVRNEVAQRCGIANSGTLPAKQKPQIDSEIRRAQRELFVAYPWLRRNVSVNIMLSADVATYDVPNSLSLGGIYRVLLLDTDGVRKFELRYDDMVDIDNTYHSSARPTFWKIMGAAISASPAPPVPRPDLSIVLAPPPDGTWTTLIIEGQMRDYPPQADDDRVMLDGEAIIQMATIRYKEFLGIGGPQAQNRSDFISYVRGMRGQEAPGRAIAIASRRADGPAYWDRPSTAAGYAPWASEWGPW